MKNTHNPAILVYKYVVALFDQTQLKKVVLLLVTGMRWLGLIIVYLFSYEYHLHLKILLRFCFCFKT